MGSVVLFFPSSHFLKYSFLREQQKKLREETASRPATEGEDAEFEEWWEASGELKNANKIVPAPLIGKDSLIF